jgi:hypothetical protein
MLSPSSQTAVSVLLSIKLTMLLPPMVQPRSPLPRSHSEMPTPIPTQVQDIARHLEELKILDPLQLTMDGR